MAAIASFKNCYKNLGFLFESLCTRDMRKYAQALDGDVLHYRDKNGLEADLIIKLRDGRWSAVEVKPGNSQLEEAAKNLLKLRHTVNTEKINEPAFLMILTGGNVAHPRADGVLVVPVGCLKD